MPKQKRKPSFLQNRRNLVLLGIWAAAVVALVAGITVNAAKFRNGTLGEDEIYRRLWYALLCFVLMSALFLAERLFRVRLPLPLEICYIVFVFFSVGCGAVYGLFAALPGWDKTAHVAGGALFAAFGVTIAGELLKEFPDRNKKIVCILLLAAFFSLSVCLLWEMFEYAIGSSYPNALAEADTAKEIIQDSLAGLGGTAAFVLPAAFVFSKRTERVACFLPVHLPKKEN